MIKKTVWMLVSCLMVLSLVIASCGPAAEEEEKVEIGEAEVAVEEEEEKVEEEVVKEEAAKTVEVTLTKLDGTKVTKTAEKPKYGGDVVLGNIYVSTFNFDPFATNVLFCGTTRWTNENLLLGAWARGPAGTGETSWQWGSGGRMALMMDGLAESFELPDSETIIYHIRHGVKWWNKPPVNGRELTANDVAWTINKSFTSSASYFYGGFVPWGKGIKSCKALDKYTVEVKVPPGMRGTLLLEIGCSHMPIFPEGITEQVDLKDWRNCIGTSVWMLTDFIPNTVETYSKNPNSWRVDPIFPENRLPYPDTLKVLLIPDYSTYMAAFRTGRIDAAWPWVTWEDGEVLIKQKPQLKYVKKLIGGPEVLAGRIDKPELPFHDLRVRQALNMAVNKQELIDKYYEGNAEMMGYFIPNLPEFSPYYIPLEEMPENVQMLFEYNPERAKELLDEAGYPNGFKTVVQCGAGSADFLSMIQNYFKDINVDMEIELLESGALMGTVFGKTHKEMAYSVAKNMNPFMLMDCRVEEVWDFSGWDDARVRETVEAISDVFGQDDAELARLMREINPYIVEQAWGVWLPIPYVYFMYWPWVGGLHGEFDPGYNDQQREYIHVWIDKDLKKSMGY